MNPDPGTAGGRTAAPWNLPRYPGATANDMVDMVSAIGAEPSRAVRRRSIVVALIAVFDPFPNVAMHVVQAERIGGKRADWCSLNILPLAAATAAICISLSDLVAPGIGGVRTSACRVFPFGLS